MLILRIKYRQPAHR